MTDEPALDLASLRLLAAVAETGSLGRAAELLDISQPAASMRLRTLERRAGLRLLDRSPTGSRLTPAGVSVVDWSRPVLDAADALVRSMVALRELPVERLRIAASLTIADHLVPGWLAAYHAAVPHVPVALQVVNSRAVGVLVRDGDAALGFVEGASVPAGVRSRVIGGDELVAVVPPGHAWARRRKPLTAEQLVTAPLVLREPGSGTREALELALARRELRPATALELGSTTAIKAAVMAGEGPAVLSRLTVAAELTDGRLVAVPVADLPLRRRFRAIWPAGRAPAGHASTLLAVVVAGRGR